MNNLFIGREKELQQLKEYLNSEQSEFITVYGRRRAFRMHPAGTHPGRFVLLMTKGFFAPKA